jgi:hypothetical protein
MKIFPLVLTAVLATAVITRSQVADVGKSESLTGHPGTLPTIARILGEIPDGTPPPPDPPKPQFRIPAQDILEADTHKQGGRTITVRQIRPIALPPPPAPVETTSGKVDGEFAKRLTEYRKEHPKSGLLFLGATVFRSKASPPRTLVRYWPEGGGEEITFWSSVDFALIAGGINSFEDSAANKHYLLMGWSDVNIDRLSALRAAKGLKYNAPNMPNFPQGKATFQVIGRPPATEELAPIQALHDIYNSQFVRLKCAYEGREKARIERESYLRANPPKPKNITLNYWRVQQPAINGKEGGAR